MTNLNKLPKITKLASKFGTPLIDAEFVGDGITFRYKVGNTVSDYHYNNVDRGIEEEIGRLERLLAVEI
jgi:hypothetical protein